VSGLIERARAQCGPVDLLVNNASIFEPSSLLDVSVPDIQRNLQINALAPLQLARAFARQCVPDHAPQVLNLLDTRVTEYDRAHAAYHVSKRVLRDLTAMLALELAPDVQVNGIAPGLILPPPGRGPEYLQKLASETPLRRVGNVGEIVAAARFLWSSRYVTGQTIYVDGGYHLKGATYA